MAKGVRHGDYLSPLLFKVMIYEKIKRAQNQNL
jgi:hypothetical protein